MRKFTLLLLAAAALVVIACRTNESPERQVDDAQIVAEVKSKLAADVGLSTVTNISVNSTNGVVTLAGQVDSEAIKARAEAVAKNVPKVVRVIDNLQVASSSADPKPDRSRAAGE
jgi:osmotically-inducible protein OsmY